MTNVPRSEEFDDVYFSEVGGLAETQHVFIRGNRLPDAWKGKEIFTICETGFGTGLNFLVAAKLWRESKGYARPEHLNYISFEKYPLERDYIKECLSRWEVLSEELELLVSHYPHVITDGVHMIEVTPSITLTLIFGDVNEELPKLETRVDCWFLDGFKPSSNPDMWSETVFQNMARLSNKGARFATFTAAGFVRRGLEAAGFTVEKVPGFGRKKEMCIGAFDSVAG